MDPFIREGVKGSMLLQQKEKMSSSNCAKSSSSARYTQGPIIKTMLKTACAMLAGTLAISGYNIVDTYFVGRLGKIPMAAMGFTFPVVMILGCVFFGMAAGIMTTTAQSLGGGNTKRAARIITAGLLIMILISALVGGIGILLNKRIIQLMGASAEALPMAMDYMHVWYLGCASASVSWAGSKLLIGAGDSNTAAFLMVAGLVINGILDPVFIYGYMGAPAMGVKGAAIATVIAQCFSSVLLFLLLHSKHHLIDFRIYSFREIYPIAKLIFRYAIPVALGMLMMPVASFIITWITAKFGDAAVAATAAAGRLEGVAFIFPMALGIPMLSMVGQNYGARLYSRIRICFHFSMAFAGIFLLITAVFYFFLSRYLVVYFNPDKEVQEIMTLCMMIIPWGFCMTEIHRYSGFFYTGCDRPGFSAWINAFRIGLLIPLSLLALYYRSLKGLFFARLMADLIGGMAGYWLTRRMIYRLPADGVQEVRNGKKAAVSVPE